MKEEGKTRAQIFGENLERIRKEKGYSRKQLAAVIGITENFFGKYERGLSLAPLDKIFELAKFLNVSILDLTGENPNIERDKIFDYRYKRAMKIATDARFTIKKLANKEISLTPPNHINIEKGKADGRQISVEYDIGFAPIFIRNKADFVQIIEDTESLALFNDMTFKQIFIERFYKKNI